MTPTRRTVLASAALIAMPSIARAAPRSWRMATAWTRNLIGPGISADRLAKRITAMSDGQLSVQLFAAGEIVPALAVHDAVGNGTIEMGHSAALFLQGKLPAASLFTTLPFGLPPVAHAAWIDSEGQELWDMLYAPHGMKPLLAGNTGASSGGWFKTMPADIADVSRLRIRATGLGGDLYRRMGATALALAPGETYAALERGVIDAAEFLAPANDQALGLQRIAPILAFPGFNKPNGASELVIHRATWLDLPDALKAIVEAAARMEHDVGLAEAYRTNLRALRELVGTGTILRTFPTAILEHAAVTLAKFASVRAW